jgi:hypothetical protein
MTTPTQTAEHLVSDAEIDAIAALVERLQSERDDLASRLAVAERAILRETVRPARPSLSSLSYEGAIERLGAAHPLISDLLESSLPDRIHRTIVAVDDAVGEAIAQGAAAHEARKPDPCVIGSLRGHIGYSAITRLRCAAEYPESAPYRAQIAALIAALTL